MSEEVRKFETGATRSVDAGRDDPEGFLSPLAIDRFCQYLTKHRVQPDGKVRDSDNWQRGIPLSAYMKGMWRHFLHLWLRHRGWPVRDPKAAADIEEDLCAVIFNAQGYLHELLKAKLQLAQQGNAKPRARSAVVEALGDIVLKQEPETVGTLRVEGPTAVRRPFEGTLASTPDVGEKPIEYKDVVAKVSEPMVRWDKPPAEEPGDDIGNRCSFEEIAARNALRGRGGV